ARGRRARARRAREGLSRRGAGVHRPRHVGRLEAPGARAEVPRAAGAGLLRRGEASARRGSGRLRIEDCNWQQVERYLERDDRLAIPLGSAEQLGVLVLPSQPFGVTPYFAAYPGSPSLREETYQALLRDLLDSLAGQGFRRFAFVNGHGGNVAGRPAVETWAAAHAECRVLWHDWWAGERVRAVVD